MRGTEDIFGALFHRLGSASFARAPARMSLLVSRSEVKSILTRTSGYLETVSSHSLQPYRGCTYGNALCGVGCYVQHNSFLTRGAAWGSFLEYRVNAAECYLNTVGRERRWAHANRRCFSVFMSSSTDPFVPQERQFRLTRAVIEAMLAKPPDKLILQTHSHRVTDYLDLYGRLAVSTDLRFHVSIESDLDRLPGLPPPASSVEDRFESVADLADRDLRVVVTVSPLLPMRDPESFFHRIAASADAVVIDHFIRGDGSPDGSRTLKTALPRAMAAVEAGSVDLAYRDSIVEIARQIMPGRVGVSVDGFAGRMLPV